MVAFGILVGYGIAAVRLRTGLASDTVIGVFFAGAIGLAAMLQKLMHRRELFDLEVFLFGDPLLVKAADLVVLAVLAVVTFALLAWLYNYLLLTGFNSSLALSRRVPVRLSSYVFVMLLATVVNLCLVHVGALLISALLIVPAATALNFTRNLRQLFRWTLFLCLFVSVAGQALSWSVETAFQARGMNVRLGIPGTIILLSVLLFALSLVIGPWLSRRPRSA
jgi:zinc transport system permease protein